MDHFDEFRYAVQGQMFQDVTTRDVDIPQ